MAGHSNPRKILWAVDAFDDLKEVENRIIATLRDLSEQAPIEVQPVYVLSPDPLDLSIDLSEAWLENFLPAARKAMEHKFKDIQIQGLQRPDVLVQPKASLKRTVELLTQYGIQKGCDCIAVGSHGRKGFNRLMLGSFAETLFLQSSLPVMVVGTGAKAPTSGHRLRILVPNDLSWPHSPFFQEVFDFAHYFHAEVTLLCATPKPIQTVVQSEIYLLSGGWVPSVDILEQDQKQREAAAALLAETAKKLSIPFKFKSDAHCNSVTQSIMQHAKEDSIDLIAMAAESGRVASALVGSITRQIVRSAPCPVWVLRSKHEPSAK